MNFRIIIFVSICISCNSTNILKYKNQKFYTEKNVISDKEGNVLFQQICYDKPRVIDDSYCYNLKITILNLAEAKRKKIIDIKTDTSIVKCEYGLFSVWNWGDEKNQITGTIEIQKWGDEEVKLKENIVVDDLIRKRKRVFKGEITFVKRDDLNF